MLNLKFEVKVPSEERFQKLKHPSINNKRGYTTYFRIKEQFWKDCPFFPKNHKKRFISQVLFWTSSFAKIKVLVTSFAT